MISVISKQVDVLTKRSKKARPDPALAPNTEAKEDLNPSAAGDEQKLQARIPALPL